MSSAENWIFKLPSYKTVKGIKPGQTVIVPTAEIEMRLDKLSITLKVSDEGVQNSILGAFYTAAKITSHYANLSKSGKRYKVNISAYLGPNKSHVLYQACPKKKTDPFVRIEFNPAKLGQLGIAELKADLATLVPDGWDYFLASGRVTRYDVAVDIRGVPINQVHALSSRLMQTKSWGTNGVVETIILGSSRSSRQITIYDKAKELTKKGIAPFHPVLTRVEARVKRTNVMLSSFAKAKSPFHGFQLVTLPAKPEKTKAYEWDNFLCRVERDGANVALGALPKLKRAKFRKQLSQHPAKFWTPKALWACWPNVLDDLGLLDPM